MNKAHITQFLESYEKHPCLWNPKEATYKNKIHRIRAMKAIIEDLGIPNTTVTDIQGKIKNIRTTYSREANKVINSKLSGGELYQPQLIWFPTADRFLRPVIEANRRAGSKTTGNYTLKVENALEATEATESDSSSFDEQCFDEPAIKKPKIPSPKPQFQVDPPAFEKVNTLCDYSEQNSFRIRSDEFDTFGQHVANQLRSLPLTNAIRCQMFINNYLGQERLKILNL